MYVSHFFIHSSVSGHLGGFTLLAIMNTAVMSRNTHCKNICLSLFFHFFGYISSTGISGSYGNSLFNFFEESSHHFPQCLHHFTVPPATHRDPVSPVLTNSCYTLLLFKNTHTSRTRLSDFTFPFHFHALEKEMATHSSVLAWRIPGTGEPGGLPSMGSHRVGHD